MTTVASSPAKLGTLAMFRINGHAYAISNDSLKHFDRHDIPRQATQASTITPPCVGITHVCGTRVPTFDLRVFCDCQVKPESMVLEVNHWGVSIGLIVDGPDYRLIRTYGPDGSNSGVHMPDIYLNSNSPVIRFRELNGEQSEPVYILDLNKLFPFVVR